MPKGVKGFQKGNKLGKTSWKTRRSYAGENNPHFGKKHSSEVREKLRILHLNEGSPTWKGDMVGYNAIHKWIQKRLPKPDLCIKCNERRASDLSNTGHTYKRSLDDWEWLCKRCHIQKDGGWGYYKLKI